MEVYEQITLDQWVQWREDIRQKLAETAGNFVHIGFRLKQIRDSGMFDGAADIFEFAEREYGLGKSTVSRFIAINEKYSEGGNSLELKEEFRAFSSSKLSEMLTLPDNEIQLITEKTTIREIRELKEFNRQEIQDAEERGQEQPEADMDTASRDREVPDGRSPLRKCLIDFFKDKEEMLNGIMEFMDKDSAWYRPAMEIMNPSGQASHKKGIVFLFLYDWTTGVKYKLLTEPEPVSLTWTELLDEVFNIYSSCDQENVWKDFYKGTDGEVSVATSQQDSSVLETAEEEPQEILEENAAAAEKTKEDPPAAAAKEDSAEADRLPGQMDVYDYPEMLPGESEENNGTDSGNNGTDSDMEGRASDGTGDNTGSATQAVQEVEGLQPHDDDSGTAENDGCAGDTEADEWENAKNAQHALKMAFVSIQFREEKTGMEKLRRMYRDAIDLAAAIEKIMIRRERDEQEHHAQ